MKKSHLFHHKPVFILIKSMENLSRRKNPQSKGRMKQQQEQRRKEQEEEEEEKKGPESW